MNKNANEAVITLSRHDIVRLQSVGARAWAAVRAAVAARNGRNITTEDLATAAEWLDAGDRRAGVARRWPFLAARLRSIIKNLEGCDTQQEGPLQ